MDKNMLTGFILAIIVLLGVATGYNYYRLDQINERILMDHNKHDDYDRRLNVLEGKPAKPTGKLGSVGSLP